MEVLKKKKKRKKTLFDVDFSKGRVKKVSKKRSAALGVGMGAGIVGAVKFFDYVARKTLEELM